MAEHYDWSDEPETDFYRVDPAGLPPRTRRIRTILLVVAIVLGIGGGGLIWTGVTRPAGQAPVVAEGSIPVAGASPEDLPAEGAAAPEPSAPAAAAPGVVAQPMKRSVPVSVEVPSIGVDSTLISLGLNPDRTVEVPKDFSKAGWYTKGPTPGEAGASVILGHIDSFRGPAVFFKLSKLNPGDQVRVKRSDGTTATFTVDARREYPKTAFPSKEVYGAVAYAGLRLITCGGEFDSKARSYLDNIVVYAHLTKSAA
jgi:sortase (surface protein transpeptidase)